jgi:hypothetical protein
LFPLHSSVFVVFAAATVFFDDPGFLLFEHSGDDKEGGVYHCHDLFWCQLDCGLDAAYKKWSEKVL